MSEPRPSLGSFIRFSNATDRRRPSVLADLRQESEADYNPATDHWKRMREAVKRDRRTTRDGASVREAAKNASDRKRASFERIAQQWDTVLGEWAKSKFEVPISADADVFGLAVHVVPAFVERHPSGRHDVVAVYFNAERLAESTINEVLRVIGFANPGAAFVPTFVDLARGQVHRTISEDLNVVDDRLSALAESFVSRWAA